MLTPAQFVSGLGSKSPTNIGFLAYNWYSQYVWYIAAKEKNIYAFTYLGGVSSGNIIMGVILGFGTSGLIILNNVAAWTSWTTDLPEGYGTYQFFFFGWRTLTPGWRTFILLWQILDTLLAVNTAILAFVLCVGAVAMIEEDFTPSLYYNYLAILCGPPVMLVFTWELIMWVELIVSRNDIQSDTDMVAVWLFVAQVVLMLMPDPWRMALVLASILCRTPSALASALAFTLLWIASTLKRIPLAMSNWRTQSTTSDALAKQDPLAVIQLDEGALRNSNVVPKRGPSEPPSVTQLEEGSQDLTLVPTPSPEAPEVTQSDGAQQNQPGSN